MQQIQNLPDLGERDTLKIRASGAYAYLQSNVFLARANLLSGKIDWLIERSPPQFSESTRYLPRKICEWNCKPWVSDSGETIAEIATTESAALSVTARDARTGRQIWEHHIPIPDAADWAEAKPAYPGAPTEEINAFIAEDPRYLVVCLARTTRRCGLSSPSDGIHVMTLPPFACQLDAIRFDISTGTPIWQTVYQDVPVGIIERQMFTGIWAHRSRVGSIDLETGRNRILQELPHELGWPVRDGDAIAVSWHSKTDVGIIWIDDSGRVIKHGSWHAPKLNRTYLKTTAAGLALQGNDQSLWWMGKENEPRWSVRVKPYIYQVHRSPETDVFVGTDGNGGRLLAFDAATGRETLNLKPALGGVGSLSKVPGHDVLVATYSVSKSYSVPPRLLVLSMKDRRHRLDTDCCGLIGTWDHGAVGPAGKQWTRLAILDVREGTAIL